MSIIGIIAGIVCLIITGGLGSWLAGRKGYSSGIWFVLCFLTGPIGLITLAGAPCQYINSSLNEIKKRLDSISPEKPSNTLPTPSAPLFKASGKIWFCSKCQTENPAAANSCKGCGAYR